MSTLPSFPALFTAALLGIAAESVWSEEAKPNEAAAPAAQTPATGTGYVPGWYPPPPGRGGYGQHWQQPVQQPATPQRYAQPPHHYPPREPYQAVQAAPATGDNPLSAELKQVQKQLATKSADLKKVRSTLKQSRTHLQQSRKEAKALDEKLADVTRERQDLQARVEELTAKLNASIATVKQHRQQLTNDQRLTRTLIADRARLRNDVANLDYRLARLLADLKAPAEGVQQGQSRPATCDQQLDKTTAQAVAFRDELSELKTRQESQKTTLAETEQKLAAVNAERDGLQADLTACSQELARAQAALATTRSEMDALRAARPSVKAAGEASGAGGAGVAAQQDPATDTDSDGVPDIIDLCPETGQDVAVESTGCTAGATITLEGVTFRNDSHKLTNEAQRILDRIAGILNQQPDLRLEVAAHTDTTGDPSYNQWLSLERAEAVMDYLVVQGVNPDRIGAAGYGGQQPVANNTTGEGLRVNRRIELRPLQ